MTNAQLRAQIDAYIKANGNREITGPILNTILNYVVDTYSGYDIVFFYQTTPPTGSKTGDIWFKTDTYALYRYNGVTWNLLNLSGSITGGDITVDSITFEDYVVSIYQDTGGNLIFSDNVVGIKTLDELAIETDPIFTASPAYNITNEDLINIQNLDGINTGDQVGDGSTITGIGTVGDPFVANISWGQITGTIGNQTDLLSKFLAVDNTSVYTPTSNYNPATKKYVDDSTGSIISGTTNYITKFVTGSSIGNSSIIDDGSTVTVVDENLILNNNYSYRIKDSSGTEKRVVFIDGSNICYLGGIDTGINSTIIRTGGSNKLELTTTSALFTDNVYVPYIESEHSGGDAFSFEGNNFIASISSTTDNTSFAGISMRTSTSNNRGWTMHTERTSSGQGDLYFTYHINSTTGTEEVKFTSTYCRFNNPIYINNSNTQISEGSGNSVRVTTNYGYVELGPQNSAYCHFKTDLPEFYFNKGISVNEDISIYGGNAVIYSASGNIYSAGSIRCNTFFYSTDTAAVFGTSSSGTVYLRPNAYGSSTAQSTFTTSLATIGTTMSVSGYITATGNISSDSYLTGDSLIVSSSNIYFNGIATTASSANMYVDPATHIVLRSTSSYKVKDNISYEFDPNLALQFKPASFTCKTTKRALYGFIAEDMQKIDKRLTTEGDLPGLEMNSIVAAISSTTIDSNKRIVELENEVIELKKKIVKLENK
jgi:hypothetical protein